MTIATGTVRGADAPFRVSAEEKRLLPESLAQARRGELVDVHDLLDEIGRRELTFRIVRTPIAAARGAAAPVLASDLRRFTRREHWLQILAALRAARIDPGGRGARRARCI